MWEMYLMERVYYCQNEVSRKNKYPVLLLKFCMNGLVEKIMSAESHPTDEENISQKTDE